MADELIPVASLARVSTAGQAADDRGGLPRQRMGIATACRRHGLRVVEAVELPGVSGNVVGQTEQWSVIRAMLNAGTIRGVVCDSIDRLCRASELDLSVIADIQRVGGSIYTPTEVRDLTKATDGLVTGLMALLGGAERREITRKATDTRKSLRAVGRWTQGVDKLPMGVSYDPESMTWSYTDDVAVIVDLATRYASGQGSIMSLATSLGLTYGPEVGH